VITFIIFLSFFSCQQAKIIYDVVVCPELKCKYQENRRGHCCPVCTGMLN